MSLLDVPSCDKRQGLHASVTKQMSVRWPWISAGSRR
jgi:hypothetical protein